MAVQHLLSVDEGVSGEEGVLGVGEGLPTVQQEEQVGLLVETGPERVSLDDAVQLGVLLVFEENLGVLHQHFLVPIDPLFLLREGQLLEQVVQVLPPLVGQYVGVLLNV